MTKYLFFVNIEDAPLILTKDFANKIDTFFEKDDKMLFINTTGQTRVESLPEIEKKEKKCRNCDCDPIGLVETEKPKCCKTKKHEGLSKFGIKVEEINGD